MKPASILGVCAASLALLTGQASHAADNAAHHAARHAHAKSSKKAATGTKAAPEEKAGPDDGGDEGTPDVLHATALEYSCELGATLTIYRLPDDPKHIALRWKKTLHRLTAVGTTTGAVRFENRKYGLLWIGIPAKGMLLDSRKGEQLANECRSAEERGELAVPQTR